MDIERSVLHLARTHSVLPSIVILRRRPTVWPAGHEQRGATVPCPGAGRLRWRRTGRAMIRGKMLARSVLHPGTDPFRSRCRPPFFRTICEMRQSRVPGPGQSPITPSLASSARASCSCLENFLRCKLGFSQCLRNGYRACSHYFLQRAHLSSNRATPLACYIGEFIFDSLCHSAAVLHGKIRRLPYDEQSGGLVLLGRISIAFQNRSYCLIEWLLDVRHPPVVTLVAPFYPKQHVVVVVNRFRLGTIRFLVEQFAFFYGKPALFDLR